MKLLIVLLLVVLPLATVMAIKDPKAVGQLVYAIIVTGAWLLETTAELLVGIAHIFSANGA